MLLLTVIVSFCSSFDTVTTYLFFTLPAWLFSFSLLVTGLWLSPDAANSASLAQDWRAWSAWMASSAPSSALSWRGWHAESVVGPYRGASLLTRLWRSARVSRLVFLAALLITRAAPDAAPSALAMGALLACPLATCAVLQLAYAAGALCCTRRPQLRARVATMAVAGVAAAVCGATALVLPMLGWYPARGVPYVLLAQGVLHAWAARVVVIWSAAPLADGARSVWWGLDCVLGGALLATQSIVGLATPAHFFHARGLFSPGFAAAAASRADGVGGASARTERFASLNALEPLPPRGGAPPPRGPIATLRKLPRGGNAGDAGAAEGALREDAPENRLGVRRFRLVQLVAPSLPAAAEPGGGALVKGSAHSASKNAGLDCDGSAASSGGGSEAASAAAAASTSRGGAAAGSSAAAAAATTASSGASVRPRLAAVLASANSRAAEEAAAAAAASSASARRSGAVVRSPPYGGGGGDGGGGGGGGRVGGGGAAFPARLPLGGGSGGSGTAAPPRRAVDTGAPEGSLKALRRRFGQPP